MWTVHALSGNCVSLLLLSSGTSIPRPTPIAVILPHQTHSDLRDGLTPPSITPPTTSVAGGSSGTVTVSLDNLKAIVSLAVREELAATSSTPASSPSSAAPVTVTGTLHKHTSAAHALN